MFLTTPDFFVHKLQWLLSNVNNLLDRKKKKSLILNRDRSYNMTV